MSIRIGVTDGNREFFHRFHDVLYKEYPKEFEVYLFPSLEKVLLAAERFHIGVVLVEGDIPEGLLPELPDTTAFFRLADTMAEEDRAAEVPVICRYRSVEEWKEILLAAASGTLQTGEEIPVSSNQLHRLRRCVFLSVAGGTGTSSCAMAFATLCARHSHKVLYVSLESVSGMTACYNEQNIYTLEDIFLAVRGRRYGLDAVLEQAVCRDNSGVHYLLPCHRPQDLYDLTGEEILSLLDLLEDMGMFSIVVLDIPLDGTLKAVLPMLNADRVVVVSDGSPTANIKTEQALSNLAFLCQEDPIVFGEKLCLLYNRYRQGGNVLQTEAVTKLGGISELPQKDDSRVLLTELSYQPAIERLYQKIWEA